MTVAKSKPTKVVCTHPAVTPNRSSTEENALWDAMMAKYGVYELARKMARRKSYREYVSHWPYDHTESVVSLDLLHAAGFDPPTTEDIALDFMIDDSTEEFLSNLTPKQRQIMEKLMDGFRPKDIYTTEGYKHTGGIRYHKWLIRKRLREQGF